MTEYRFKNTKKSTKKMKEKGCIYVRGINEPVKLIKKKGKYATVFYKGRVRKIRIK